MGPNSDENDFNTQRVKLNELGPKLKEKIETHLKFNGYYEKETVDKETFIDIFMKVITDDSFTNLQMKNFRYLANELAEREGDTIRTKDIPTILNFPEITQLYSELIDEGFVNINSDISNERTDTDNIDL